MQKKHVSWTPFQSGPIMADNHNSKKKLKHRFPKTSNVVDKNTDPPLEIVQDAIRPKQCHMENPDPNPHWDPATILSSENFSQYKKIIMNLVGKLASFIPCTTQKNMGRLWKICQFWMFLA